MPHALDLTPTPPYRFVWRGGENKGKAVDDEDMVFLAKRYNYKHDRFKPLFKAWNRDELVPERTSQTPPLRLRDGKLTGHVDVYISPSDKDGDLRNGGTVMLRIAIDAAMDRSGRYEGTYTAWQLARRDPTAKPIGEQRTGPITGMIDDDFWQAQTGTEYAPGKDWPNARGPMTSGGAVNCGKPLVSDMTRARLLWVAEDPTTPGMNSTGGNKNYFTSVTGGVALKWVNGQYGGPIVVDGRVYFYQTHPDLRQFTQFDTLPDYDPQRIAERRTELEAHLKTLQGDEHKRERSALSKRLKNFELGERLAWLDFVRGLPTEARIGRKVGEVVCVDARTGQTLWKNSTLSAVSQSTGKSGRGLTPCYYDGRIFARAGSTITAMDAKTGKTLWRVADRAYLTGGQWSRDQSIAVIDGVLIVGASNRASDNDLVGIDVDTGEQRWRINDARGFNAPPTKVIIDEREYVLAVNGPYGLAEYGEGKQRLVLIDAKAGEVLWEHTQVGYTAAAPAIWKDIVLIAARTLESKEDPGRIAAFRVSTKGATKLWEITDRYANHRHVPVAHNGVFYLDPRTKFSAIDAATGEILGTHPHIYNMSGGDHNWTWIIASDNRLVTKGAMLFSTAEEGFKRLPGRIGLQNAGGYWCPVKPAMADGRLFYFSGTGYLVCFDLRQSPQPRRRIEGK